MELAGIVLRIAAVDVDGSVLEHVDLRPLAVVLVLARELRICRRRGSGSCSKRCSVFEAARAHHMLYVDLRIERLVILVLPAYHLPRQCCSGASMQYASP